MSPSELTTEEILMIIALTIIVYIIVQLPGGRNGK